MKYKFKILSHFFSIFLLFLFLSTLFFWKIVYIGEVLFFGDNLLHIGPNMHFWKESISNGYLPLWNPYIFAGIPHLANPATNTLSPLNLIFFLFENVYYAISFLTVSLIALAGVGMYGYLKSLNLSIQSAILGGILFSFSGSMMADVNDLNSLQSVIFIPFVLWSIERFILVSSWKNLTLVSIILTLQFFSGHPQYAYYTWLLVGSYYFFRSQKKFLTRLAEIVLIYTFFIGLVAVVLIPFLELSELTYRPSSGSFNTSNSLEVWDLPRLILGNFYGSWIEGNSWGPFAPMEIGRANSHGFLGLVSLSLASLGIYYSNKNLKYYFGLIALTTFILSFGYSTPVYYLTKILPLFDKFRTPMRLLSIYSFSIAVLASIGMEHVQSLRNTRTKSKIN